MSQRVQILFGAGFFVLCATASYLVTLAVMAEPGPAPDRTGEMNAILDSALPQGADATPLILEAQTIAQELRDDDVSEIELLRRSEWGDPRLESERALWRSYADKVIPLIRSAAQCDVIRDQFILVEGHISRKANVIDGMFWIMHSVVLVGLRESYENADWESHFEWVETGSSLIRMLADRPVVMDGILARSLWLSLFRELRTQAIEGELPESVCHRLTEHLLSIDRRFPDFSEVSAMHRLEMHASFDKWFAPSGLAVLPALESFPSVEPWNDNPPRSLLPRLDNVRALFALRRIDVENELDEHIAVAVASVQSDDPAPQFDRGGMHGRFVIPGIVGFRNVVRLWGWPETEFVGTILMLRLAAYFADHGRWPESLTDAASMEETIDPLTGKPFRYELTPDDRNGAPFRLATDPSPEAGRGAWLFSHPRQPLGFPYE